MVKDMRREKRCKLLDILVGIRTYKTLDRAVKKDRLYCDTLKQQDEAFAALHKAGLNREQSIIVDRAITATNECGAVYGKIAYKLGLRDGIRLESEIRKIK